MDYIMEVMPSLISGMGVTLSVFFWTLVGSLPLGLIVALGMMSRFKILQKILGIYVWLMRGTPLLLQLIFVFYGLPLLGTGIVLPRYEAALVAFILNYTAYFAEIFRGAYNRSIKGNMKVLKFYV